MEFQASCPHVDSFILDLPSVSHESQLRGHEDLLRRLYVTENKSTKAVMEYMETHFQLKVGLSTYTRVFRELNIRKNAKGAHWAYVDDRIRKRQIRGKPSHVYARGRLLEPQKVKKEIARNVSTLQQIASATGLGPATPDGWSVETPRDEDDTIMESLEDEAMIDNHETTTRPDDRTALVPTGNAATPSNTNQAGNSPKEDDLSEQKLSAFKSSCGYFNKSTQELVFTLKDWFENIDKLKATHHLAVEAFIKEIDGIDQGLNRLLKEEDEQEAVLMLEHYSEAIVKPLAQRLTGLNALAHDISWRARVGILLLDEKVKEVKDKNKEIEEKMKEIDEVIKKLFKDRGLCTWK